MSDTRYFNLCRDYGRCPLPQRGEFVAALVDELRKAETAAATSKAEISRLRAALRQYGEHAIECPAHSRWNYGQCRCGLEAVLKKLEGG